MGKGYKITKLGTLNIQGLVSRKKCKIQFLNDFIKKGKMSLSYAYRMLGTNRNIQFLRLKSMDTVR